MFSRRIIFLTNGVRLSLISRTYRNTKTNRPTRKTKDDSLKGNPGGNRLIALALDGESPDIKDVSLEDIENGENDMLDSHLLYDQHVK